MTTKYVETTLAAPPCFGVHKNADGLPFLFQDSTPNGWSFYGNQISSEMMVPSTIKGSCTHNIVCTTGFRNPSNKHLQVLEKIIDDPLVQAMLPLPEKQIYFINKAGLAEFTSIITSLERLSSPLNTAIKPYWSLNLRQIDKNLTRTNIHPMVLLGFGESHLPDIPQLIQTFEVNPRSLILVGDEDLVLPKQIKRISTEILEDIALEALIGLPMEHLGLHIIGNYCKGKSLLHVE